MPPGGVFGQSRTCPARPGPRPGADWVRQLQPNVVVLLAGGGEVLDRLYRGQMTNILNPTFAAYVESQLEKAVRIATAHGALMVFETKPCQSTGEQPNGQPWPQDSPARQDAYNALLHQVAAQHPGQVYVQDLNSYVCPGGNYTEDLDGVPVRQSDGSHFDMQPGGGGDYLAPAILPYWVDLGHLQEARTNGASVPERDAPPLLRPAVRLATDSIGRPRASKASSSSSVTEQGRRTHQVSDVPIPGMRSPSAGRRHSRGGRRGVEEAGRRTRDPGQVALTEGDLVRLAEMCVEQLL